MMENQAGEEKIVKVNIENQMKSAYIDYSMSVIVSRALPDVRDGLKPVHRRVLFGMLDLGVLSNRPYKKSARIVGEVLGKYHPHGDSSVYDAMVRMAQDWSLRYPLVDGQGNFGSIDGDSPAAMRYTEARLRKIAEEMLSDINKDTVDFQLNFDDSLEEPTVLPARIPNLLVNGASGIAVGMATNMPPHNLSEVVDGVIAYIDNHEITIPELMKFIKAPDFPTGGFIYGYEGVKDAYETGRGRIIMRGESKIETDSHGRESIIVTSIPYQVNKAEMIRKTADLINDKKIEGISDIRDESDRNGLRVVYELKRDAITNVVLNKLYQFTQLQTSFSVNNICLVKGRPMLLNLKQLIQYFVEHRHEVVIRRTRYELNEAEKRAHILEGLLIALDHIDEVIALIRSSRTPEEARNGLIENFSLTEIQARAILDMRLQRLTGLERDKIREEYNELLKMIDYYRSVLDDEGLRMEIIKNELLEIKASYGDEARTEIVYSASDFRIEDTIADENVVITISHMGYIKRTPLSEYRRQNRGGRGAKGSDIRDEDFLEYLYVATMHNYMLFFTEKGKVFWMRVYEIPEGTKTSKGRAIQNLINIEPDDKVRAFINLKSIKDEEYINNNFIILCTRKGIIKKTSLEAYSRPRQNGINAITIRDDDQLLEARLTNGNNEVLMALKSGRAIRFNENTVRPMGRNASGVKGITLANEQDEVVGMICPENGLSDILVVSEKGYGKRSKLDDYRITNRGGKGVKTINITEKTGQLISIDSVTDNDDLMIINRSGLIIRLAVADLRIMGRATQGVRLINLRDNDSIAAVTKVEVEKEEDEISEDQQIPLEATETSFDVFPVEDNDEETGNDEQRDEADENGPDIV
ncbi:DNA gyrase subunit A [Lentimicrobium sp.]|jgi:DNA gyrase subunit A|uniref:DNA gyrase subunit A n=1 Tax=Lentimicrobium sp. TaxID=2034841 RepID=UPI0025E2D93D|nr:DNA gyrase subunit A [Lentimicrobium sp.]MCO5255370.1 DNA gyrase subunit A [Lentimicrobium sp.]MCO5261389.1 DNA gyrase subunit A [Lentimicrobium sp.]HPF63289.1 DNA gyrase subunit A [Lentimicrobium sp.]HPJ61672.1 DNA gyrase subunit A [Lentimicrobium sp.]HPR24909.1 DNA gyrase subunit A [Lentimicrobium sp.]